MEYDILFLGKIFPKEIAADIKSKMITGMQDAANALQWNIIDGLDANEVGTIKIIDMLPVNSYPKGYKDPFIEEYIFNHSKRYNSYDKVVGLNNITILKQFVNKVNFKKEIHTWMKDYNQKKKIIISYTADPMFLSLLKYAKSIDCNIETVCIVADLPEFIHAKKIKGIKRLYTEYLVSKCKVLYKYVDKYVLLTEHMAEKLNIKVPYMVMEGISTTEYMCEGFSEKDFGKYVFYSGTLNYSFGIETLLDAFSKVKIEDLSLVICGTGEAESEIIRRSKEDQRLVFLGRLDRNIVLNLQKNALMLINPRQNNEEFTKYSFPSKNLEYLSSGVPVIAYKLDGIPDEYDKYFLYPQDNSSEELARKIENVCYMSDCERNNIGRLGQDFVNIYKNRKIQAKRMIDFISKKEVIDD